MQLKPEIWIGSDLPDDDFADLARDLLSQGDITLLPNILLRADLHRDFWSTDAGQVLLTEMLALLLDTLEAGNIADALTAMNVCPPHLAQQAHDLLLCAFCPDGILDDPAALDDIALLCLALLLGASGQPEALGPFIDRVKIDRIVDYFMPPATAIVTHFAPRAHAETFKPKLIIWDLDDTLWQGTLADGDEPLLDQRRADHVRTFNQRGIVSAICSKNNFETARAKLIAFGLWDEFVFPHIAFVPKGAVVKQMIADMRLRPANVLFIDDNPHNLYEVADVVPGIHVIDATSPECDALLQRIADDHAHVAKSRVADYRMLETKVSEREENALTDESFLMQSGIHATFTDRMDNLEFAERIEELINRSNQLNYTESRVEPGIIRQRIQDIDNYEVLCSFVWDKYGYYGLVGVAVFNFRTRMLEHFAFSCRIMHMGVEDYLLRLLEDREHLIEARHLRKPLPPQSAQAITAVAYSDPAVRAKILAQESPRDWSKVQLRLMADCQSGAFHHYSRFREEVDFDNNPRLFSLPMMLTGAYKEQDFPHFLVYTAATDYIDWRWLAMSPIVDVDIFKDSVDRFTEMVIENDHECLLFLPPEDLPIAMYELHKGCVPERSLALHPVLNAVWREVAARHPDHFILIELADVLSPQDMVHAHHYTPAALQRIAGMIDDWYADKKARWSSPLGKAA